MLNLKTLLFLSFLTAGRVYAGFIPSYSLSPRDDTSNSSSDASNSTSGYLTPELLIQINDNMTSCNSDPDVEFASECRNATQAAPLINAAFEEYNITSVGEQAAILSWMIFASENFKYDRHHWPGIPGQGTRSMMSADNVKAYALAVPETQRKAEVLMGLDFAGANITEVFRDNLIRQLVLPDELSFASASWYYARAQDLDENNKLVCQRNSTIAEGLRNESLEGWKMFITDCVVSSIVEDREAVYNKTLEVLKKAASASTELESAGGTSHGSG